MVLARFNKDTIYIIYGSYNIISDNWLVFTIYISVYSNKIVDVNGRQKYVVQSTNKYKI